MLEKNLEECLNNAFKFAHENNHEFVTTEHLLLCILNNQDALNVLLLVFDRLEEDDWHREHELHRLRPMFFYCFME